MNDGGVMEVTLLAFGPLAEIVNWKRQQITVENNQTVTQILHILKIEDWIEKGLIVARNGIHCELDTHLENGDELALLPPVSGG